MEEMGTARAVPASGPRPRPALVVWLACALEWLVPGAGYLLIGRPGRGAAALAGVAFLLVWGIHLDGELDRAQPGQTLSYLGTFACLGTGLGYLFVASSEALRHGLGEVTSITHEYGTTFVRAAGLIGYLLILDVYDIAVGRKT